MPATAEYGQLEQGNRMSMNVINASPYEYERHHLLPYEYECHHLLPLQGGGREGDGIKSWPINSMAYPIPTLALPLNGRGRLFM